MSIKVLKQFIKFAKRFSIPITPQNLKKYKQVVELDIF
ncbi:hypothetical protein BN906_01702 [Clostridium tetani 12124569]|nr:hypothetical protein BN906_01702 [Clostridium tetani 12124569]